ncbi:hydroxyethylthiazole kinase [Halalkalibacter akibai]|uniref:Hydroxyethylthiazole kinase n=1 Tax=Halalkalibacter akibai (strain ATCC 43226 / DSM 21942 / CIP 109018 / JCM 9157 / 1139) TaxID=1236973 RepID=W4QZH2_HALA3|nr:hydroxyethylthiazole kinase [Halalkalibacter akibai]GAE36714.1 hydroxyethylthiazole kinase [Halalkalibacter akibai JCM 9157]
MMIEQVRKENPLIHCMTNVVVTNFTANGLLALGASPVMAYAKEEVADLAQIAGALLLNIGTLSTEQIDHMIIAGQAANEANVPVVLDPVGAGATSFRTTMSKRILEEVKVSVLRGNAGEIASLLGVQATVKGVDGSMEGDKIELAKQAAKQFNCVCVVTGEVDVITDGSVVKTVANGHPWLTKVVGTGCLLGAVIGAFIAVERENLVEAATTAVTFFGIAGEQAFQQTNEQGIGSFQEAFLNQLHTLTDDQMKQLRRNEA